MANFIANANANFSGASTWATCDGPSAQLARFTIYPTVPTGNNTQTTSNSSLTTTTTGNVFTAAFTPSNGGTGDGLLMFLGRNATGSNGTFTCGLSTDGVNFLANQQVTINVTDIPFCGTSSTSGSGMQLGTWMFFKFPNTVAFNGVQTYRVGVTSSVAGSVNVFRGSATATDFTRLIRLTAAGTPGASDVTFVCGEWTAAATVTARTVTVDTGVAVNYGKHDIGVSGTVAFTSAGASTTRLKFNQYADIWSGGTMTLGTSGSPIPSTSSSILEFESTGTTAGSTMFGLNVNSGGAFTTFGNAVTQSALLNADASAAATTLTSNISTGWLNGDIIGIASTTTTASQTEKRILSGNAAGTTITITAGLTNAHSGTSPTQAELINLVRNVKVQGIGTGPGFIFGDSGGTISCTNTEFTILGTGSTPVAGVTLRTSATNTPAGSATFTGCAIHDVGTSSAEGFNIEGLTGQTVDAITISNCNIYCNQTATTTVANQCILLTNVAANPPGNNINISGTIGMFGPNTISSTSARINVTNCTAAGNSGIGFAFSDNTTASNSNTIVAGTFTGNTAHSNGTTAGISCSTAMANLNWSSLTVWRNTGAGISFSSLSDSLISQVTAFGNSTQGMLLDGFHQNVVLDRLTFNAGVTNTQPTGITFGSSSFIGTPFYILNSTFGATTTHATADWNIANNGNYTNFFCNNVSLASATQINNMTNLKEQSRIGITRFGQVSGSHKVFFGGGASGYGTITSDNVLFKTAAPSEKMTLINVPTTSRLKLEASPKRAALNNTQTTTVSVWVRQSVAGDGAAYNGSFPTLVLKANPGAGILSDTTLATGSAAGQGAFELLSATTSAVTDDCVLEFTVQSNGTAGFINVDDWSVT